MTKKLSNPKIEAGIKKWRQYMALPVVVLWEVGIVMLEGARKYGRHNMRVEGVLVSTYTDAAKGHIDQFIEGEDFDPDSTIHHISHAIASLVTLRDGMLNNNWVDDRPPKTKNLDDMRKRLQKAVEHVFEKYPNPVMPYTELNKKEPR
jgi:hypothetical protein